MATQTYNGYSNYETWNVELWIDNDEGSQDYWLEQARTHGEDGQYALARQLESEIKDEAPELSGCYADLLNAALGSVNWYEIAENLIEQAFEE